MYDDDFDTEDLGSILSDVGDAASSVTDAVGSGVSDVVGAIPGASAAVNFFGDELQDFANTTLGNVALRAFASFVFPGLAAVVGPQLAAVSFAIPGVAKGDSFDKAWLSEFLYRCKTAAEILGTDAAGQLAGQFQPAVDRLTAQAQAAGIDVQTLTNQLESQTGAQLTALAAQYGVSPMMLQTAIDYIAKKSGIAQTAEQLYTNLVAAGDNFITAPIDAANILASKAPVQHTFDPATGAVTDSVVRVGAAGQMLTSSTSLASSLLASSSKVTFKPKGSTSPMQDGNSSTTFSKTLASFVRSSFTPTRAATLVPVPSAPSNAQLAASVQAHPLAVTPMVSPHTFSAKNVAIGGGVAGVVGLAAWLLL